jgi:hypothetical protein
LNPDGGAQRAGIAWFIINPNSNKVILQGYLGAAGYDFVYPAIGVTASGRGVMAFTATGDTQNPSSAFAGTCASYTRRVSMRRCVNRIGPGGHGRLPQCGSS